MTGKRVLIVLGGQWHDFDGFAATIKPVLESAGHSIETTCDLDSLTRLRGRHDTVLLYTCLGGRRENDRSSVPSPTDAQVAGLVNWVREGGALLAAHAATMAGQSSPALRALMGGMFVSHPPQFAFTIYPLSREHPITIGVEAFTVHDELYIQEYDASVQVHMVAVDRGVAYPMVWSKGEGKGRVAHIALGHGPEIWQLRPYQRLTLQAIAWLTS
jgi:type 1 glutamine amidotransferase